MAEAPRVTVLMPVRDGARYLRQAIDSVLAQTYRDFELLIVDDGSTDDSAAIAASYTDQRIRLARNGGAAGLTGALNAGIDLARGEFIARMDADDISLPERLARQVAYLEAHPRCAVVAVKIRLISPEGEGRGVWESDARTTSFDQIRRRLPRGNCVPHPGVMIRTSVLRRYRYRERRSAQDYDLWLRLCADGQPIEKIDEPLLDYRLHADSVSSRRRESRSGAEVEIEIRRLFLRDRLVRGRFGRFDWLVLAHLFKDAVRLGKRRLGRGVRALGARLRGRGAAG